MEQTYPVYEKNSSRDLIGRKTGWIGLVGNLLLVLIKRVFQPKYSYYGGCPEQSY